MPHHDLEASSHVGNSLEVLSHDRRLNVTGREPAPLLANMITVRRMLERPCVVYLDLAAGVDASAGRFVARFLLALIHQAVMNWRGPRVPMFIVFDEAQELLSRSVLAPLAQLRSFQVSTWWLHQTLADLKRDGADFTGQITGNPAVSYTLGMRDPDSRKEMEFISGKVTRELESEGENEGESPAGPRRAGRSSGTKSSTRASTRT
jgi:hypothetical protein